MLPLCRRWHKMINECDALLRRVADWQIYAKKIDLHDELADAVIERLMESNVTDSEMGNACLRFARLKYKWTVGKPAYGIRPHLAVKMAALLVKSYLRAHEREGFIPA